MKSFILLILLVVPFAFAQANTLHFVLSKDQPLYIKAQQKIEKEVSLQRLSTHSKTHILADFSINEVKADDLVITIGNQAAINIQELNLTTPAIYSFVDNHVAANLKPSNTSWISIVLNQPIDKMILVAEKIVIDSYKKEILVVISEGNDYLLSELDSLNNEHLTIVAIKKGELAAKKIQEHLFTAGVLIAINDKNIWSVNSAKLILQQAFTHKVPVVGYSKNFLIAGALVSVYSPIDNIASETANQINQWLTNQKLPNTHIIYPNATVEINANIARALRVPISLLDSLSIVDK